MGVMFYIETEDGLVHKRLALTARAANGLANPYPETLAWLADYYGSPVVSCVNEEWAPPASTWPPRAPSLRSPESGIH